MPILENDRLIVGPDRDDLGSQIIHDKRTGTDVGRYIDDQDIGVTGNMTPAALVAAQRARNPLPRLVIAGIPQGRPDCHHPGALNALEWYPFWGGRNQLGLPPPAEAYILQRHFAWPGQKPPTLIQRVRFRRRVKRRYPGRILLFY